MFRATILRVSEDPVVFRRLLVRIIINVILRLSFFVFVVNEELCGFFISRRRDLAVVFRVFSLIRCEEEISKSRLCWLWSRMFVCKSRGAYFFDRGRTFVCSIQSTIHWGLMMSFSAFLMIAFTGGPVMNELGEFVYSNHCLAESFTFSCASIYYIVGVARFLYTSTTMCADSEFGSIMRWVLILVGWITQTRTMNHTYIASTVPFAVSPFPVQGRKSILDIKVSAALEVFVQYENHSQNLIPSKSVDWASMLDRLAPF